MPNRTNSRTDLTTLAAEKVVNLIDEHDRLWAAYQDLKRADDDYGQEVHTIKRDLMEATQCKSQLQIELDRIESIHRSEITTLKQKHQDELAAAQDTCTHHQEIVLELKLDVDRMRDQINSVQKELRFVRLQLGAQTTIGSTTAEMELLMANAEEDNDELTAIVEALLKKLPKERKKKVKNAVIYLNFLYYMVKRFFRFFN